MPSVEQVVHIQFVEWAAHIQSVVSVLLPAGKH